LSYPTEQHAYPSVVDDASPHGSGTAASPTSQSSLGRLQFAYPGLAPTSHVRGAWAAANPSYDPNGRNPNIHPDLAAAYSQSSDERLGVDFLLDSNQRIAKMTNGLSPDQPGRSRDSHSAHHSVLPRFAEATCPLDALLLDFLTERQRLAAQGASSETLVGPLYPNFNALLNRATAHYSHPLSKVFTDILRTFPDLSNLPEQVAVVYVMFLIMRWCCEPTKENYERMPEWIRPRPCQLFSPHPIWLDNLPW